MRRAGAGTPRCGETVQAVRRGTEKRLGKRPGRRFCKLCWTATGESEGPLRPGTDRYPRASAEEGSAWGGRAHPVEKRREDKAGMDTVGSCSQPTLFDLLRNHYVRSNFCLLLRRASSASLTAISRIQNTFLLSPPTERSEWRFVVSRTTACYIHSHIFFTDIAVVLFL